MSKKIKIFLGGFINLTNAQNLNCLAIAKHLDKEKFEVYTLELFSGNLESQIEKISGVKIFNCFKPFRISGYLGFLWGIWNCDVTYLPKGELWKFNRFLLKLLNKKSFSTAEGILDSDNLKSAVEALGTKHDVMDCYSYTDKKFPITKFIGKYNQEKHELVSESSILYLGCDSEFFRNSSQREGFSKVVYIGRLKKRKGVYDFLELAKTFPKLDFLVFGDGEEKESVTKLCVENKTNNCKLMGVVSHLELALHLAQADLHVLPSRSEGFPKVILETAAAGVPSIVYGDYGASEWITTGENGWVVNTIEEIINLISKLEKDNFELKTVSKNALELAKKFDWSSRINDWEVVIENIFKKQ